MTRNTGGRYRKGKKWRGKKETKQEWTEIRKEGRIKGSKNRKGRIKGRRERGGQKQIEERTKDFTKKKKK